MRLAQVLFTQGFGTRRECEALIMHGWVEAGGRVCSDPAADVPLDALMLRVRGEPWPYYEKALLLMHKPAGHECSRNPRHHPSVLALLPAPLRRRGVQPIGRLDADTTGALLLTDDGALIHRLTSPRQHVPKVYEVGTRHPLDASQVARLLAGVALVDEPGHPARATACEIEAPHRLRLVLTEGRYHQVKRMIAAVGNRVERLHRSAFGTLALPAGLAPGQWRWVSDEERAAL